MKSKLLIRKEEYNEASISRLRGLEGVRVRPNMYIGNNGVNQLLTEAIDNAIDEALAGYNDFIGVYVGDPTGYIWVWDNGRGIPIGPHPSDNKTSTLTIIMTELHAGSKLEDNAIYQKSRGTHGVGISVTNALSQIFEVYTFRRNVWWAQRFQQGKPVSNVVQKTPPNPPFIKLVKGTLIRFIPDLTILKDEEELLDIDTISNNLETESYLIPQIHIVEYRNDSGKIEKIEHHHPNGLKDYLKILLDNTKSQPQDDPLIIQQDDIDLLLQWSNYSDELVYAYTNALFNVQGGTHINGLRRAITDVLTTYAGVRQQKFKSEDLRAGLLGVINVKLSPTLAKFDSQTKNRLITREIDKLVYNIVYPELENFFKKHKQLAKAIIERANAVRFAHESLRISKEAAAGLKTQKGNKIMLPIKLVDCNSQDRQKCELYIIEGDSAKGTAKNARFTEFQAVLPLTGKPPNAIKEDLNKKVLTNERVRDILRALGWQPNYKQLRYGKIILLADADEDGNHITCLLIALLHQVIPEVFTGINGKSESMVYIVDAPLYIAQHNGQHVYGATLADISKRLPKNFHGQITRLKGWGECRAEDLETIAFNPKTRRLIRIDAISGQQLHYFLELLGEDVAARKEMLGI